MSPDRSRIASILLLVLMGALSVAANISLSFRSGRLAIVPIYDDTVYLNDAYTRLLFDNRVTPWGWMQSFLQNPPHAPMGTLTALIGFTFGGPSVAAPYITNAWIVAIYIATIYLIARGKLGRSQSLMLTAVFLFAPAAHAMTNEFRPDMAAGLLFAVSLYLVVTLQIEKASPGRRIAIGLLAALAVVAKPSALVITVPILGLALILCILLAYLSETTPRQIALRMVLPLAAFLTVIIPFLIVWGPGVTAYILQALVTNADIWATPGSWQMHWSYHSFGWGGTLALGLLLPVGLVFIALDSLVAFRNRRQRDAQASLSYYAILVVLYVGMSMTAEKTLFQGSFFYLPFLIGTCLALSRRLAFAATDIFAGKALTGVLCVVLALFAATQPAATTYTNTSSFVGTFVLRDRLVSEVETKAAQRLAEKCDDRPLRLAALGPNPIPPPSISLAVAMQTGKRLDVSSVYFSRTKEELYLGVVSADLVLQPGPGHMSFGAHLPSYDNADFVAARLLNSGGWTAIRMPSAVGDFATLLVRKGC